MAVIAQSEMADPSCIELETSRQSHGATSRRFANGVLDFGVMGTAYLRFCALPLTLSALLSGAQTSPTPLHGRISLPDKDWGAVQTLPGFVAKTTETKLDGRRYMVAENASTNAVVSVTLEETNSGAPAASCRQALEERTKHPPLEIQDVRFSRSGDFDVMRYLVADFRGQRVNHESLFACQFYDNAYIDVHVSKVNYVTGDEAFFADVLNSIHVEKVQRSSMELFGQASGLYVRHDYKGAIGPYSQALELEKANPALQKSLWYVLIDNLGVSYGITGNLQKAKETFDYGVSRDPEYPLFYYNLACTYAEMDDAREAKDFLKKAFDHKANTLPGESMPDPRKDDSFKKLMKDEEFKKLAETLSRSQ